MLSELIENLIQHPYVFALWGGLTGMCIGSFAGVVVDRLPQSAGWRISPGRPQLSGRSRCNTCHHALDFVSLVPILGWLLRGGECAFCGDEVSPVYPSMEALFFVTSYFVCLEWGVTANCFLFLLALWTALTLAWIDLCEGWLPERMTIPLVAIGIAFSPCGDLETRLIGAAIGVGSMSLVVLAWSVIYRQSMLAGGDILLLAACGGWFGKFGVSPAIIASCLVFGLAQLFVRITHYRWRPRDEWIAKQIESRKFLPFGPSIISVFVFGLLIFPFISR